jgi:hypothetical protein
MKTFSNQEDKAEIFARLRRLRPDSQRQWGKMTAHQAICHLTDSFKCKFGERESTSASNLMTKTLMKWIALKAPFPWPHGVRTMPENDQEIGGTPPDEFERDRQQLELLIERFCQPSKDLALQPHPYFGQMTEAEWLRWGYLHCDHHLRQFGV